jgi:hypothetical protein
MQVTIGGLMLHEDIAYTRNKLKEARGKNALGSEVWQGDRLFATEPWDAIPTSIPTVDLCSYHGGEARHGAAKFEQENF